MWRSRFLFHTRVSILLNLHRILPRTVIDDVAQLDIPINSKEGFIRQVLGWRGILCPYPQANRRLSYLARRAWFEHGRRRQWAVLFGRVSSPAPVFWGTESGLKCLDHVVSEVWELGYSHHINRLMVLSNWGTLLGISPRALSDWFWVGFEDAFDWVVEPNVLGMGTFAVGTLMVTKPYVSGSAYISKMSDYCDACAFHPKKTCPMTSLYWQFLERHQAQLASNPRMRVMLSMLKKRAADKKAHDRDTYVTVTERLSRGQSLTPDVLPPTSTAPSINGGVSLWFRCPI